MALIFLFKLCRNSFFTLPCLANVTLTISQVKPFSTMISHFGNTQDQVTIKQTGANSKSVHLSCDVMNDFNTDSYVKYNKSSFIILGWTACPKKSPASLRAVFLSSLVHNVRALYSLCTL